MFVYLSGPLSTSRQYRGGNKDGTVGKPFLGVRIQMVNVDPKTKEGELAFYSRNTFMGYIKVTHDNFRILNITQGNLMLNLIWNLGRSKNQKHFYR